jgi:hypothetical protein
MTDEEAWGLKAGDQVEVCTGKRWVPAVVVERHVGRWGDCPVIVARRLDNYPTSGAPYKQLLKKGPGGVRKAAGLPRLPANVYADFLSEMGEDRAAQMLRDRFPLDDGTG